MFEQFQFLMNMPCLANVKDTNSIFIGFSNYFAKLLGWKSAHDCLGKTDYDIPCPVADFANEFREMDKKVIDSGEQMLALDIQNYDYGWRAVLAEKNPIKDVNGKVTSIFSSCIDVTDIPLFKSYLILHQEDIAFLGKSFKPVTYILSSKHSPLPLTEKQENCLFLMMRGKSIKEIAKLMKLSPRTVECHIEAIKIKLNCQKKSEIIEKAIDSGFLFYIPRHFQNNLFIE